MCLCTGEHVSPASPPTLREEAALEDVEPVLAVETATAALVLAGLVVELGAETVVVGSGGSFLKKKA